jgi:hypothetical protein
MNTVYMHVHAPAEVSQARATLRLQLIAPLLLAEGCGALNAATAAHQTGMDLPC